MQNAVLKTAHFKTEIENDPVKLFSPFWVAMHLPISEEYPYATLTTVLERFLAMHQMDGKNASKSTKGFE